MAEPVNTPPHSNQEDEAEDSATSKPEKQEEDKEAVLQDLLVVDDLLDYVTGKPEEQVEDKGDKEVVIEDIMVLRDLVRYQEYEGELPFESLDHMEKFCYPWIRLGYGNFGGWNAYFEKLKNKYKNRVGPIEPGQEEEFGLWETVFGNEGIGSNELEDTGTSKLVKQEEEDDTEVEIQKLKTIEGFLEYAAGKRTEQVQEFDDGVNRKQKEQVEDEGIKEVLVEDSLVLKGLVLYKWLIGVYPFESSDHMQKYCSIRMYKGQGNMAGWNAKIEHLKNKYKNHVGPIEPGQEEEYDNWKMVFGNEGSSSGNNDDDQKPVA